MTLLRSNIEISITCEWRKMFTFCEKNRFNVKEIGGQGSKNDVWLSHKFSDKNEILGYLTQNYSRSLIC